jgi:nucleotide-binding universal stress UspA family protein
MKKIVIPFDGTHFSEGAFAFAEKVSERETVLLAGLFLPEIMYPGPYGFTGVGALDIPALIPLLETTDTAEVNRNIKHFKELCVKRGIEHRVHKAIDDFALPQLKKESRFDDLLIIGSQLFYNYNVVGDKVQVATENDNEEYLASLLHHAECPVLLVPESYEFPKQVILAYDGSESSVYAIKQFAYLFPELCDIRTLLVYAGGGAARDMPDVAYIEELASRHFKDLTLATIEADPDVYFETWLLDQKAPLLVTGAYERSSLSLLFKESFADKIIADRKMPVFIAHK